MLADIGAGDIPELVVLNKADKASQEAVTTLRTAAPGAVVTSARTGEGIEELRAAVESRLPKPEREMRVLLPYERGDLVNRIHTSGELLSVEHTEHGSLVTARVHPDLAGELGPYALAASN